jgi:hypothetical protein
VRVHGSIVELPLIGEKDRRTEFALVFDRVASKPAPLKNRRDAAPGNLLLARVKITSYNHPAAAGSAPLFRASVVSATKRYSEEGADNVI